MFGPSPFFPSIFFDAKYVVRIYAHAVILPSGSGESGKSTIVKQMKIIHQNGYTRDELLSFRPLIWKNLLESAHDVIQALSKFNLEPITPANKVHLVFIVSVVFVLPHSVSHRRIANVS
jgi:G-protein alpha subunit